MNNNQKTHNNNKQTENQFKILLSGKKVKKKKLITLKIYKSNLQLYLYLSCVVFPYLVFSSLLILCSIYLQQIYYIQIL